MIDLMRRKGVTRVVALATIAFLGTAPAQAVDFAGDLRLQNLQASVEALSAADDQAAVQNGQASDQDQSSYTPAGRGEASYYGRELAGNRTASGERFNPAAMTAAHRSLPLGSMVRVTNVANGLSVVVRVNDRGPFARSRIIDVSLAAAREIRMTGAGKAQVRLDLVHAA